MTTSSRANLFRNGLILLFVLFNIIIISASQANWKLDGNSELAQLIGAAPENSWIKLNINRYDSVWTPLDQRPAPPDAPSVGAPNSIIEAWSSMAWDSNRGNIIIWGGGHANYPGNESYIWNSTDLKWSRGSLPSEVKLVNSTQSQYEAIDGVFNAPIAAHTYDNSEFFPVLDRFITFGGAAFNTGDAFEHADDTLTGPYFFDPALADENAVSGSTGSHVNPDTYPNIIGKQMWTNRDNLNPSDPIDLRPGHQSGGFRNGASAYAQEDGIDVLYLQAGNELFRYSAPSLSDPSLDTYDLIGVATTTFSGQGAGAYDPERKIFVRTAGGFGDIFTFWDLSQTETIAQNTIITPDVINGTFDFSQLSLYGLDYDNIRKVFVLWDGNKDVWQLIPPADLTSGTWTLNRVQPDGISFPQNLTNTVDILGKWKYAEALDAYIGLINQHTGDIWVYKPENWQPQVNLASTHITFPLEDQIIYANEPIEINAFSLGSNATEIQILIDGSLAATANASPISLDWGDRPPGDYTLTAKTTYLDGTTSLSTPVQVTVSTDTIETITLQEGLDNYVGTSDAYIYQLQNTINFGNETILIDKGSGSRITSLVHFSVFDYEGGPIADGAIIRNAKLSLYKTSPYDHVYQAYRILSSWTESDVTWNQREPGIFWNSPGANDLGGDIATTADDEASITFVSDWLTFDVTDGLQTMSNNISNHGWKLVPISGNANIKKFSSSEYAIDTTLRPILEIEYISSSGPANSAPIVTLTAPLSGNSFEIGSPILLTATANDTDGTISKVAFFADDVLLGEVTSEPYEFSWTDPSTGSYILTAVATDDGGKFTKSTEAAISVTDPNTSTQPPNIDLTQPSNGATFSVGAPIQFAATADDPDGSVTKVAFFANDSLLAEVTTAPYQYTWSNAPTGSHTVRAVVTDDGGNETASANIQVTVSGTAPPGATKITLQEGLNGYAGTIDAYLYEFHNTNNFGEKTFLQDKPTGTKFSSLVRFAIFQSEGGPVPDGATITSATLSLFKTSFYDHTFRLHRILSSWIETDVTWEQREPGIAWNTPGANDFGLDINATADGEGSVMWEPNWLTIDVTNGVQSMSANGINYGWKLIPIAGNPNPKVFSSSEYTDDPTLRPILEVEYLPDTGGFNFPPTVSITAPSSGSSFEIGSPILLTATANDTDGTISKVAFFADDVLLGEVTSEPYEFSWTDPSTGSYILTAVATDDGGKFTKSTEAAISVTDPNTSTQPPNIDLTQPSNGATFSVGAPIQFAATADDPDGSVTKVAFFANDSLLAEVTTAPYQYTWSNAPTGSHTVRAVVTDDGGNETASANIQVTVSGTAPPGATKITLQEGLNGYAGTIDAYLYEFHNTNNFGEKTFLQDKPTGTKFSSLVRFAIFQSEGGPVPDGATITSATLSLFKTSFYDHTFRLHRILSSWIETDVTWEQREPGIAWNTPGANDFGLDINATADGEGSVMWEPNWLTIDVTNGVQSMSANGINYGWKLVPIAGNPNPKVFSSSEYTDDPTLRPILEVEYLPNTGGFNFPPTVSITAPSSGSSFEIGSPIHLTATANDTDGTISKVAFFADDVLLGEVTAEPYEFSWTNPSTGSYILTAVATDDGGKSTTSLGKSIDVSDLANTAPTVSITDPIAGSKHEIGVPILIAATANDTDGTIAKVAFYANGNLLAEVTQAPYEYSWTSAQEGMHSIQVIVTDNGSLTGQSEILEITVTQSTSGNNFIVTLQNGLNGYLGTQDSQVSEFHNFNNFGEQTKLNEDNLGTRFSIFIQFAIFASEGGPVPDLATITSAKLRLYKSSSYDYVYRAHPVLLPWSENQITWSENQLGNFWNVPGGLGFDADISSSQDGEASISWSPGWLEIDVTQGIKAIQTGRPNHGWRLLPVSGNNNLKTFISSEYVENALLRPALVIEYLIE